MMSDVKPKTHDTSRFLATCQKRQKAHFSMSLLKTNIKTIFLLIREIIGKAEKGDSV
jgi:hypothetical protein